MTTKTKQAIRETEACIADLRIKLRDAENAVEDIRYKMLTAELMLRNFKQLDITPKESV